MSASVARAPSPSTTASEARSFEALAETYRHSLFKYAYRLCGNKEIAEDLVQDSLLRAWRSFARLQNPAAALGWMKTIVRRENARRFERIQPRESAMPTEELPAQHAQDYDTSTDAFVLRRALRALPTEYREPLILQVLHGYSQQEIAARLGLSAAGAGTRLFRARQQLRAALGERS
ncbi:MAG: sigma-70 family RNA polymerase sigma factor [Lamprobacter sp.]|uniref:sigma-70 family RNA polymerase sigma factor n=1 Tax=Lamprobacter sp. TaxID=3100796 RepID=UPI002B259894|nr:sigma-70 family RNA polymerase sigma factor [Lamprobacter sp.]MEA3642416.1 sigma-70 family RNA polymerase sigma factor [Lamprobacter sp.]